jgi:hypothetical protein
MQPYRNDLEALEARHAALEAEVADKIRRRDEAARMLEEARARQRAEAIAADYASGGHARRQKRMVAVVLGSIAFLIAMGAAVRILHRGDDRARRMERMMAQFEAFTDDICACTDSKCAMAVTDRMTKWAQEASKTANLDDKPDAETMERAQKIGTRMSECMTKAMSVVEQDPSMRPYGAQEQGANSHGNSNDQLERE